MRSVLLYSAQVLAIGVVGYALWHALYGKPDIDLAVWMLFLIAAAAIGLIPYLVAYLIGVLTRRRRSFGSDAK